MERTHTGSIVIEIVQHDANDENDENALAGEDEELPFFVCVPRDAIQTLNIQPQLIPVAENNNCCAICQENNVMHSTACKHYFHPDCLQPWLKTHDSCPVCRHPLRLECSLSAAWVHNAEDLANITVAHNANATQTSTTFNQVPPYLMELDEDDEDDDEDDEADVEDDVENDYEDDVEDDDEDDEEYDGRRVDLEENEERRRRDRRTRARTHAMTLRNSIASLVNTANRQLQANLDANQGPESSREGLTAATPICFSNQTNCSFNFYFAAEDEDYCDSDDGENDGE
jgi:hypothetical protein